MNPALALPALAWPSYPAGGPAIAGAGLWFGVLGIDALAVPTPQDAPDGPQPETSPSWERGEAVRRSFYLVEIGAVLRPDALLRGFRTVSDGSGRIDSGTGDRTFKTPAAGILEAAPTFRFASEIYATTPSDTPANTPYEPRLDQALSIERQIPVSPLGSRRVQVSLGRMVLLNADGELDEKLRCYAFDGQVVRVLKVDRGAAYSTAELIFTGTATGAFQSAGGGKVEIAIADNTALLDKPLQPNLFTGAGGLEGGDDAKGKPKPVVLGYVRNIQPVLIDYATQLLFVGEGPIQNVDAVRDNGAAISYAGSEPMQSRG